MTTEKWIKRWGYEMAASPTLPGVWKKKHGGFIVRARVKNERTGKLVEVLRSLPGAASAKEAFETLAIERRAAREEVPGAPTRTIPTFKSYVVSLLERKIAQGEIRSAATRELWGDVLEDHLIPAFGSMPLDLIRRADVEQWKASIASATKPPPKTKPEEKKPYSPTTLNVWLRMLRTIMTCAIAEYELDHDPLRGVRSFDTSTVRTHTIEEPNALLPEEVAKFLSKMRVHYPQHYAIACLGFALGSRPSSLRALRRGGATPDVLLDDGIIILRRSHTRGTSAMNATKTKRDMVIHVPPSIVEILRWHIATQITTEKQTASDLLFPTAAGGFRSTTGLWKPFVACAAKCGLEKKITPKAMRRTFQDLARAAQVHDLVTRSISGHATETMQFHYSTANASEQRDAIAKVVQLFPGGGKVVGRSRKRG